MSSDTARKPLRVLILQHEAPTPPGVISEWLDRVGALVEILRIDIDDREVDPNDYDLIVSLGSEFAAFDDSKPFVPREADLMERAVDSDVPVLGLCFGGQMLARAIGGKGFRGPTSEIGWLPIRSADPELVPEGPWFQWHFDTFTVPPTATVIAETDAGPQAFVSGRSLGLQFHPEVTLDIMEVWINTYRHELDDEGVNPDALLEETRRRIAESQRMARHLLERYLTDVASLGEAVDAPGDGADGASDGGGP